MTSGTVITSTIQDAQPWGISVIFVEISTLSFARIESPVVQSLAVIDRRHQRGRGRRRAFS
jgi:hypothetical protein